MRGRAVVHGAITVVNAIAIGKGAALGVDLSMEARVEITEKPGEITVEVHGQKGVATSLAEYTVKEVFARCGSNNLGANVETFSEIPVARGLKSSSAVSNAVALAALAALGRAQDDREVLDIGVDASLKTGVTVTGAFDDASASYFGGFVVTDNPSRKILRQDRPREDLHVLILVPEARFYTAEVDVRKAGAVRLVVEEAFSLAMQGRYMEALAINGLAYSAALGFDAQLAIKALQAGAISAGLSGKGPAVAALCREEDVQEVSEAWSGEGGKIIHTRPNTRKAEVLPGW